MRKRIRLQRQQKMRFSLRKAGVVSLFLLIAGLTIYFQFSNPKESLANSVGDYQTRASGNWEGTGTWRRFDGTSWQNTSTPPTSSDGVITIQSNHSITITANKTIDQVVVNSGCSLIVNSGISVSVNDGAGKDLSVFGTLRNAGTISGANVNIENTGVYQHNFTTTQGAIPVSNWAVGSTCEIVGYTTNTNIPNNFNQSFSNFTWNCTAQSANFNFNNNLLSVGGNFRVQSTGSGSNQLILLNNSSTFNCGGDLIIAGGTLVLGATTLVNPNLTIAGNYNQTGGTFNVVTAASSVGTITANGNWSHTGGTLTTGVSAATRAQVIFAKAGVQTFNASSNTISGIVDFSVNAGSTLSLGTSVLRGRNFTLSAGSTIGIGSSSGITNTTSGNIQSTGTRTFPATANYIYEGTSSQNTGNALPSSINDLTINNSNNVTLAGTVAVGGTLNFLSGRLITSSNEISVTNSATTAIIGYSNTRYVVGNLRRSISSSGSYDFPLGSSSNYQLANLNLSSVTGTTSILGRFSSSNPIVSTLPLRGIFINNFTINKMLDAGFWTFTPNTALTGGNYNLTINERGHSKSANYPNLYTALNRTNSTQRWGQQGTHNSSLQTDIGGTVTAVRNNLTAFGDFAIAYGVGFMTFENDSLISGTAGQVNATYLFRDVSEGIDAWVKIESLNFGATVDQVDQTSGGYLEAWQPIVNFVGNDSSSITWRITFKKMNTSIDTVLQNVSLMAVDVDGSPGAIREMVETNDYTSYRVAPNCSLNITNSNGVLRAVSDFVTFGNIDSTNTQAMFQIDKRNVSTMTYTTGSISIQSGSEARQFCLFFKPFFNFSSPLPIALSSFAAKSTDDDKVQINWTTASEKDNDYFTIERSQDGRTYSELTTVKGAGNSTVLRAYSCYDNKPFEGKSYYRLKQTDYNGDSETFNPVIVSFKAKTKNSIIIAPNPFTDSFVAHFESSEKEEVEVQLLSITGISVYSERIMVDVGNNSYQFNPTADLKKGVYLIRISNGTSILGTSKVIYK